MKDQMERQDNLRELCAEVAEVGLLLDLKRLPCLLQ